MSEEGPSDDPDRLREVASAAVTANRAALRARAVPIDVEPPTVFSAVEPRRPSRERHGRDAGET